MWVHRLDDSHDGVRGAAPRRRARARGWAGALVVAAALTQVPRAHAQTDEQRAEARERFDRGLRLFNQGDNGGALAEFERAYALVDHPVVLFNIGLVRAAAGQPVQAVEAFDELLGRPRGLDAERLERARAVRAAQAARVAEIEVRAPIAGATVEVDGVEVGRTPLAAPVRVASGQRLVVVVAPGHAPARQRVTVAGRAKAVVELALVPLEGSLARLEVDTSLLDAEIWVDGQVVGHAPLAAPLVLPPGERAVEVRRPGYRPARAKVTLGQGASGRVALEPEVDRSALAREGGRLRLVVSEPNAVVFVDGAPSGPQGSTLMLPPGRHLVRVERAEFFPFEREVQVPRGGTATVAVELEPTPEHRAAYAGSASSRRTWGWITAGAGGVALLGGGGFLLWNSSEKSAASRAFEREAARNDTGGDCDPALGLQTDGCLVALDLALTKLEDVRSRDTFGWVGVGVGAAAAALGVTLVLTGDDPDRYEPRPESDVFGRVRAVPVGWVQAAGGGVGLLGTF
ncbi:MAG: PEGA domain-containing protein [Polyangiaceae bacterium]|nr:PEGA domain-containing protein [Polyangiaceae bacterium]